MSNIYTTKDTKNSVIEDLEISELTTPGIQVNIIKGTIIGVDIHQDTILRQASTVKSAKFRHSSRVFVT